MAILNFLIGDRQLRRQRDAAKQSIRELYDPSIYNPQRDIGRRRMLEGAQPEIRAARESALSQMFAPDMDTTMYGGRSATAIASSQSMDFGRSRVLSDLEGRFALADIEARRSGEQTYADALSRQRQTAATRESQLHQADMMYEAERSARRQALGRTVLGVAGTLATTPFGPAGTTLAGVGLQQLFGRFAGSQGGGFEQLQKRNESLLALERLRSMAPPEDELFVDMPTLPELDIDFGDPLSLPERVSTFQPQSAEVNLGGSSLQDMFAVSDETLPDLEDDTEDDTEDDVKIALRNMLGSLDEAYGTYTSGYYNPSKISFRDLFRRFVENYEKSLIRRYR